MTNFDKTTHPDSKYWSYASLRLDEAAFLLSGEDPEGECLGKHYSELPERIRRLVDILNNAVREGELQAKNVYVTRRGAKERIKHNELGRNEYVDWDTELPVSELQKWCDARGRKHPWNIGKQHTSAPLRHTRPRSDREDNLLRVIAALRELSELPKEHYTVADKLSALMESWGWEKPSKGTIADTILKEAAKLPRNIRN